jgi:hypothetical protein
MLSIFFQGRRDKRMLYKIILALPLLGLAVIFPWLLQNVEAHGRLIEPPSRATMWR